ncbi:MAG: hypothetical protein JNJ83_00620 [Verrucomicrobiaceae bacterium]|nr:hypothetical protein [Verrucomicrobiaceae bacterium]
MSEHRVDTADIRDQPFATFRKTDPTREYTATFLQDRATGATAAITLEVVSSSAEPVALATTYFRTFVRALLETGEAKLFEDWLTQAVRNPASAAFGGFTFVTNQASDSHRRITIQPSPRTS